MLNLLSGNQTSAALNDCYYAGV